MKILHLSDLHIPQLSNKLNRTGDWDFDSMKKELINDISKEFRKKDDNELAVAIFSGDLIDRGRVELFSDEEMYEFLEAILEAAEIPKENTIFVPGNHDAKRPDNPKGMIPSAIKKFRAQSDYELDDYEFDTMCNRFEEFTRFCSQFSKGKQYKSYGVIDFLDENKDTYRFIRINSALTCLGKNDYGNLFLTENQLADIMSQVDNRVAPKLTFLVMHHPMDWLSYKDKYNLNNYMIDHNKFNVDIILNGHIHNGQIGLRSDLDTNIISLATGVGYTRDKKKATRPSEYRYAIYDIDANKNSLKGILRIANKKGEYRPDTTLYNKVNNDGTVIIPLKIDNDLLIRQLDIPLSTKILLTDEVFGTLVEVISALKKFENLSYEAITNIARKGNNKEKIENFSFEVCAMFYKAFFSNINRKNIRIHIRHYIDKDRVHRVIGSTYGDENNNESISDMEWDNEKNLIKHSYKKGTALVASLNPEFAYFREKSKWDEFLTVAVSYPGYKPKGIPAMSFGVSFQIKKINEEAVVKKIQNRLYCLSCVGFEQVFRSIVGYADTKFHFTKNI